MYLPKALKVYLNYDDVIVYKKGHERLSQWLRRITWIIVSWVTLLTSKFRYSGYSHWSELIIASKPIKSVSFKAENFPIRCT